MAGDMNLVIMIGRLGKDPEIRSTQTGKQVASFSLACTEKWSGGERTEWNDCVAWEGLAKIVGDYCTKGKQVAIQGSLYTEEWTDKEGKKRTSKKIRVTSLQLLGGNREGGAANAGGGGGRGSSGGRGQEEPASPRDPNPSSPDNSDDIPF